MMKLMKVVRRAAGRPSVMADQRGLSTVEYTIILVLIAASAIGLWVTLGGELKKKIDASNKEMENVQVDSSPK